MFTYIPCCISNTQGCNNTRFTATEKKYDEQLSNCLFIGSQIAIISQNVYDILEIEYYRNLVEQGQYMKVPMHPLLNINTFLCYSCYMTIKTLPFSSFPAFFMLMLIHIVCVLVLHRHIAHFPWWVWPWLRHEKRTNMGRHLKGHG